MKRTINLLIFGLIFSAFGFAQTTNLLPVAVISLTQSEPITVGQLRTEVSKMETQAGRPLTQAERRQVLDVMINEKLVIQAAARDRITVTDNEINQQIQQLRNNMAQSLGRAPTETEFAQAIRSETGLELPAFREQLRKQLLIQKYLMEKKRSTFENMAEPTEAEIRNHYNLTRTEFIRPETVQYDFIHVPFTDDPASKARARDIANRLVREINNDSTRFNTTMLRAQAANSDYQAGDGGYLPRNLQAQQIMGAEFFNVAFNLKDGEISRLIEGPRGFTIIKIIRSFPFKNLELDDIAQLGAPYTVREYIHSVLLMERQQATLERASQELITDLRRGTPFQIIEANLNY